MGRLFNYDAPIMQGLSKASAVFFCGIAFLLCSCTVIGAGAAATAMYRMMFNLREDKPARMKDYFACFAREFRNSFPLWLLDLLGAVLLAGFFYLILCVGTEGPLFAVLMIFWFILLFVWAFTFCYVFPLTSYFENSTANTVKNAFLMSVTHRRQTIPALFLAVLPILIFVLSEYLFLIILPLILFILVPAIFYFQTSFFSKVFDEYLPEKEDAGEGLSAE